jgi:hypothetical protein
MLAQKGRKLDSLPADMARAIGGGGGGGGGLRGKFVCRFAELQRSPIFCWMFRFGGFRERLLTGDLFFPKVAME